MLGVSQIMISGVLLGVEAGKGEVVSKGNVHLHAVGFSHLGSGVPGLLGHCFSC